MWPENWPGTKDESGPANACTAIAFFQWIVEGSGSRGGQARRISGLHQWLVNIPFDKAGSNLCIWRGSMKFHNQGD